MDDIISQNSRTIAKFINQMRMSKSISLQTVSEKNTSMKPDSQQQPSLQKYINETGSTKLTYKEYIFYSYKSIIKMLLVLNNPLRLICHKSKQTKPFLATLFTVCICCDERQLKLKEILKM